MVDYREAGSLGERIQAARKFRGVKSARALAEIIDGDSVTESILQNIEAGRLTNISVTQLLNIAFALKVAPSFFLAPLGRPDDLVDLKGVSAGIASMTSVEFDAWLSGLGNGSYRPTSAAEMSERNELSAWREFHELSRERARLEALRVVADEADSQTNESAYWTSSATRINQIDQSLAKIASYLESAGWPGQAQGQPRS